MIDGWLEATLRQLLAQLPQSGPRTLTLDQVGQAVGSAPVSPKDIEALFDRLEEEGVQVGEEARPDLPALLATVLRTARELRAEGKKADKIAIAEQSGLSVGAVHIALLYADVLRG